MLPAAKPPTALLLAGLSLIAVVGVHLAGIRAATQLCLRRIPLPRSGRAHRPVWRLLGSHPEFRRRGHLSHLLLCPAGLQLRRESPRKLGRAGRLRVYRADHQPPFPPRARRAAEAIAERRDSQHLYETAQRILAPGPVRGARNPDPARDPRSIRSLRRRSCSTRYPPAPTSREPHRRTPRSARAAPITSTPTISILRPQPGSACFAWAPARGCAGPIPAATSVPLIATAIASLVAVALERGHSFDRQCHAEAARQSEQLRTAVLEALAHEFKTPLTIIHTVSSGLLAAGDLSDTHTRVGHADR